MSITGFHGIVVKEFRHMFRDFRTLIILFVLPVLMLALFGYALSMEIKNIDLKIEDLDGSLYSRGLIRKFEGSSFFTLVNSDEKPDILFKQRKIHAVLTIPADFSKNLTSGNSAEVGIIIDGSDGNKAMLIRQYITSVVLRYGKELRKGSPDPVIFSPVYMYNQELESTYFFVPGLTALIVIMVTALLTSLTITREKESGTFNLIKLSPLNSIEIIIGKVVPYLVLSFVIAVLIIICAVTLFRVPVRGSVAVMLLFILVYCFTGLSFGIFVSTLVSTQQAAMLISLMTTLLPTLFLSGFIFQVEAMPVPLRILSRFIPARYFLIIIRGVMLKGNTISELLKPVLVLLAFSVGFLALSVIRFKRYLER